MLMIRACLGEDRDVSYEGEADVEVKWWERRLLDAWSGKRRKGPSSSLYLCAQVADSRPLDRNGLKSTRIGPPAFIIRR